MRPPDPLWIFGYGSLVWRPAFPFEEQRAARLDGWKRRFWQGSTDHRGVPGAPGRVVTLLEDEGEHCWGKVFRVAALDVEAVLERLDHREQGGYDRYVVEAAVEDGSSVQALMWVARHDNENYLGEAPLPDIARQVLASTGPSGPNDRYVLELDRSLREMGVDDPHVSELAKLVRGLRGS